MTSTDEDFPRGGTLSKPAESTPAVQRPEVDNLFQVQLSSVSLSTARSPHCVQDISITTFEFVFVCGSSQNLKEGMLMLGCVKEITDFEVTVSLPCGMQGFLSIKNISDSYTKLLSEQLDAEDTEEICSLPHLFFPGMVFRCVVARLDIARGGSVSIQLSVNPKLVNKALTSGSVKAGMVLSGCVESVEDHGYMVDIGISGSKAFLPKKAVKDKHNIPEELKVGQYVTSQVEEVKNDGRVVRLSVNPSALAQAYAESQQGWNLTNLLPGLLVKAKIKKVTKHGLILDFLSSFSGQVDFLHMEPEQPKPPCRHSVQVRACVLYVDPSTRLVGLSLRSYLIQPGTRVDTVPAGGDRIVLAKPEHTCRVLDFSPMDQIHFVSLRMYVAQHICTGTVSVLLDHGMMVHLSDHIKGLVPRTHLSDIILKNPEKKYTEGMKVKCRVLSVDVERKRLALTRKKALVESTLPLFLSYADARRGRVSHGYIVSIREFGCFVRFYNDVRGLVPVSELSSEPIINPKEVFYVGQVVKAKVLQCDPEKEKMTLSLRAAVEGDPEAPPKPQFDCVVGQVRGDPFLLEVKVVKKAVSILEVAILPADARAVLPTMHLSDHMSNCPLLWESLQEGDTISNLVCISKNKQIITLTKKPTVKWSLEEGVVAKDFSDITVGMQLIGWIKNMMSYGVFVEFPYGLVGLAPKSAMTDKFLSDATTAFQLGQTVIAKVTNLDEEKQRFLVTLKVSEVMNPEGDAETRLIRGLQERRAVAEMLTSRGTQTFLNEESKYTAMVQHVDREFAVVSLEETAQLTVIQTTRHLNDTCIFESDKLKPGVRLSVTVLRPSCQEMEGLPLVSWERAAPRRQHTLSESHAASKGRRFGEIVTGKVRTVKPTCVLVALEDGITGSVHVSEVAENVRLGSFPTSLVKVGSVVTARVIGGQEYTSHRFLPFSHPNFKYTIPELSLLPRKLLFCCSACYSGIHKLEKGGVTLGMVTNVQPHVGLVMKLPFGATGTVAITDLADAYRPNPLGAYSKDQLVRCYLLESENNMWKLSLRPSRLNPEKAKPAKDPEVLSVTELKAGQIIRGYIKSVGEHGQFNFQKAKPSAAAPSRLQVSAGFSWDAGLSSLKPAAAAQEAESSDGEDQEDSSKSQKKSRHELELEKKAEEKALVQREAELMDPNLRPQDSAAFERLLLASPNSSLLWLQYMAHHLQATQIEQARAVAERALKTISFREEQEKLNVWVALLNLENMYGTEESLKKVFERALQFCEPMPVYQQLADMYAKSNKTKEAEGLYKTMVKRFRQNKAVWLSYGTFLLQQGQSDAASALLQRALKSLPSKESVDVIAKFAQLEFRYGDAEKGRSMFDKVLTSYPKRTDLWSVFIDLMVKHGSQKEIRALFDRVIHLSVAAKKIKFFFKRYLEYEKRHGTPESIQAVKDKALEFVEAKGTEAAC
uniref:Protein RRP5 homolog n=1 Tax=Myripristis murdjan TaxID=586833 RepID=A0A667XVP7_9TELE